MEELEVNDGSEIWILSPDLDYNDDNVVRGDHDFNRVLRKLDPVKFKEGINRFKSLVVDSIDSFDTSLNKFQLDEITLKIDINAEGQVLVLGTGGKVGGTGGIQLKFTRKKAAEEK